MADITNHPFTAAEDAALQSSIAGITHLPYLPGHSYPHVIARRDAMLLSRTQVRRLRAWLALNRSESWIATNLGLPDRPLVVSEARHYWHARRPEPAASAPCVVGAHAAAEGMCPAFPENELKLCKQGLNAPWCVCRSGAKWGRKEMAELERAARSGADEREVARVLHRTWNLVKAKIKVIKKEIEAKATLRLPGLPQDHVDEMVRLVRRGATAQECVDKIGYGLVLVQMHHETVRKFVAANPVAIKVEADV